MQVPMLGFRVLRGHNSKEKKHLELSPLIVWDYFWDSEHVRECSFDFQVNIFCNNRDTTKCQFYAR